MKRTTVFLDEALESDLRAIARRQQRPMAEVVREAMGRYVAQQAKAAPERLGFLAIGRSGHSDTAERHEELLWQEAIARGKGRRRPGEEGRGRRARGKR